MFELKGKYTTARVYARYVEPECSSQIYRFLNHPAFTNPVSIMPDTHAGTGSVIGFTMPVTDKVIPNVIGVDIGCGMYSINLGDMDIDFEWLDREVRRRIPTGPSIHGSPVIDMAGKFPWMEVTMAIRDMQKGPVGSFGYEDFKTRCKEIQIDLRYAECSLGTLGGGNHFIEAGRSGETGDVWFTIHTGSRNLGAKVCEYWQRRANSERKRRQGTLLKAEIEKIKMTCSGKEIETRIKEARERLGTGTPSELAWLEGTDTAGYLSDMILAQVYAHVNRNLIAGTILDILTNTMGLAATVKDRIETIHNFIDPGDMIIRKGAIRSYIGERMVIPFSMKDGLALCEGKSNEEWNFSAPHGAGRLMSRADAKRTLDLGDFREQMAGIYTTSVCKGTLDEAPGAYKDMEEILELIEPTAKVIDLVKPLYNLKDKSEDENPDLDMTREMPGI